MNTIVDKPAVSMAPWEKGAAIFSTNSGKYGRRIAAQTDRPPLIMRSDPDEDMAQMVSRLQRQYPSECRAIQRSINSPIDVYSYFDHYDVYIHGYHYLHEVLSSIAFKNLAQLHQVLEFVDSFKSSQVERFKDIHPETLDLFTEEEKTIHGQDFLGDALVRLKALKLAAGNVVKQKITAPPTAISMSEPSSAILEVSYTSTSRTEELRRQSSAPDHARGSLGDDLSASSSLDMNIKLRRQSSAPSPPRPQEILVDKDVDASVDIAKRAELSTVSTKLGRTSNPRRRSSVSAPFSPRPRPLPQRVASAQGVPSASVQHTQRRREHYTDPEPQHSSPADQHLAGYQLLGPLMRLDSNEAGYPTVKAIPLQPIFADGSLPRIPQYGELAVIKNDAQQLYYNRFENEQSQGRAGTRQSDHRRSDPRRPRQPLYQGPPDNLPTDMHYDTHQRHAVGYRSSITTPGMHPINAVVWGKPNDMSNFYHPGAFSPIPYYAPQPEPIFHARRQTTRLHTPRRRQTFQNPQTFSPNNRGPPGPGAHTFSQPGPTGPLFVTKTRPPMGFSNDARVLAQQDGLHRGRQLSDAMPYRAVSDSPRYGSLRLAEHSLPHPPQFQETQSRAVTLTSNANSRRSSDRFYEHPYTGSEVTHQTIASEPADQATATPLGLQNIEQDTTMRQISSGGWSTDTNPYAGMSFDLSVNTEGFDRSLNMQLGSLAIEHVNSQMQSSSGHHNSGALDLSRNVSNFRPEPGPSLVGNTPLPFYQSMVSTTRDVQYEGPRNTLSIRGNKVDLTSENLLKLFSQYGKVDDLVVESYRPYAFVTFETAEDAARAIDRFHDRPLTSLGGRRLQVRHVEQGKWPQHNRSSIDKGSNDCRSNQPTNMRGYNGRQGRTSRQPSTATVTPTGAHNLPENLSYHGSQGAMKQQKKRSSSSQQISPVKFNPKTVSVTKMQEELQSFSTHQPDFPGQNSQNLVQTVTRRDRKSPKKGQNQNESPEVLDKDASPALENDTLQQENIKPVQAVSTAYEDSGAQSSNLFGSKPLDGDTAEPLKNLVPVRDSKVKNETAVEASKNIASKDRHGQASNHWSNSNSKPIALEDYIRPKHSQKRKKESHGLSISGSISIPLEEPHGEQANNDQGKMSASYPGMDGDSSFPLRKLDPNAGHGQTDAMDSPAQFVYSSPQQDDEIAPSSMEEKPSSAASPREYEPGSHIREQTSPALQIEASSPLADEMEAEHSTSAYNNTSGVVEHLRDVCEHEVRSGSNDKLSEQVQKAQISGPSVEEGYGFSKQASKTFVVLNETMLPDQLEECSAPSKEDDTVVVSSHEAIVNQEKSDLFQEPGGSSTPADTINAVAKSTSVVLTTPGKDQAIAILNTCEAVGLGQAVQGLKATPTKYNISKLPEIPLLPSPQTLGTNQVLGTADSVTTQNLHKIPLPGTIEIISTPIETRKKKQFGTKSKRTPVPKKPMTHASYMFDDLQNHAQEGKKLDLEGYTKPEIGGNGGLGNDIGLGSEVVLDDKFRLPTSNVPQHNEDLLTTKADRMESEEPRNALRSSCPSPKPSKIAPQGLDEKENAPGEDTMNSVEVSSVKGSAAVSPSVPKAKSKKKKKAKKKAKSQGPSTLDAAQSPSALVEGPADKYIPEPEMPYVVDDPKPSEPNNTEAKVRTYNHPPLQILDFQESTLVPGSQAEEREECAPTETQSDFKAKQKSLKAEHKVLREALLASNPYVVSFFGRELVDKMNQLASRNPGLHSTMVPKLHQLMNEELELRDSISAKDTAKSSTKLAPSEPSKEQESSVSQTSAVPLKSWTGDYYPRKNHYSWMLHKGREKSFSKWADDGNSSSSPSTIMDDSSEGSLSPLRDNSSHFAMEQNIESNPTATDKPVADIAAEFMASGQAEIDLSYLKRLCKAHASSSAGDTTMDEVTRILGQVEDAAEERTEANLVHLALPGGVGSVGDSGQPATDNSRCTSLADFSTRLTVDTARHTSVMEICDDSLNSGPAIKTSSSSDGSAMRDRDRTSTEVNCPTHAPLLLANRLAQGVKEVTPSDNSTEDMPYIGTTPKSKEGRFSDLGSSRLSGTKDDTMAADIETGDDSTSTQRQTSISTSLAARLAEGKDANYAAADKIDNGKVKKQNLLRPLCANKETTNTQFANQPHEVRETIVQSDDGISSDMFPPLPLSPKAKFTTASPAPRSPKGKGKAVPTDDDLDTDPPSPIPQPSTPTRNGFSTSVNKGMNLLKSSPIPSGVEDLSPKSSPHKSRFSYSSIASSQSGASEAGEGEERPFKEKPSIFEEFLGKHMNGGDPWALPRGEKRWGRGKK